MSKSKGNILFQLTGSIACYKACNVISQLVQNGFNVKTICSQNALKFIGKSTLEGLTHNPVYTDTFEEKFALEHIEIIKWLDAAIICPATANIINKIAGGIGDDYISTVFLAFDFSKPYLIAPAMNKNMCAHPATARSIKILKDWGVKVLDTASGYQACGDSGDGRLLKPNEIYEEIIKFFTSVIHTSKPALEQNLIGKKNKRFGVA
ncbi:MAG: flavoprotein [Elusimicrobia bacterium]|nr:flavoprotein [Elusimicrobiota bacterium]